MATTPPSVIVGPNNPLQITDDNRTFDKVEVQAGGVISVSTTADVDITTLKVD